MTASMIIATPGHPGAAKYDTTQGTTSRRQAAWIAGIGYVLLFGLAIFANFVVREGLVVADDATATAANIAESNGLFRLGLVSFLAIFVIDVVVAWALYIVFRNQHRDLSLVAAWFRLVYTVFLGVAAVFLFQALAFYDSVAVSEVLDTADRNAQAMVSLDLFNSAWMIGLAAFGVHLIVLGVLVTRSKEAPRWLGLVMVLAGLAYIVDTTAHSILVNYSDYATSFTALVAIPSVVGEGWFGLWLLLRAGKSETV
ncbi:MAG: DUF4386 domain-containing protein [Acidimicrobiales bacterium]